MSKKAIKKLNDAHKNYAINVELGGADKTGNNVMVKAFIQVFDPKYEPGKQPTVIKTANSYGTGADLEKAQAAAIENAVESLGL